MANGDDQRYEASGKIPTDDYSRTLARLMDNPAAVVRRSTITTRTFYGDSQDWILQTVRVEGADTTFVQRIDSTGGTRLVLPPEVTDALARQRAGASKKVRRTVARRVMAERMAQGYTPTFGGKRGARRKKGAKK